VKCGPGLRCQFNNEEDDFGDEIGICKGKEWSLASPLSRALWGLLASLGSEVALLLRTAREMQPYTGVVLSGERRITLPSARETSVQKAYEEMKRSIHYFRRVKKESCNGRFCCLLF
jgi:hypothetical protein